MDIQKLSTQRLLNIYRITRKEYMSAHRRCGSKCECEKESEELKSKLALLKTELDSRENISK